MIINNNDFLVIQGMCQSKDEKRKGENLMYPFVSTYLNLFFYDFQYQIKKANLFNYIDDYKQDLIIKFYKELETRSFTSYKHARNFLFILFRNYLIDEIRKQSRMQFVSLLEHEIDSQYSPIEDYNSLFFPEDILSFVEPFFYRFRSSFSREEIIIFEESIKGTDFENISQVLGYKKYIRNTISKRVKRTNRKIYRLILDEIVDKKNSDLQYEIRILKKLLAKKRNS